MRTQFFSFFSFLFFSKQTAGNTKGGSITVLLTSCLTCLDQPVLQIRTKIVGYNTADSKPVKQEVNCTVILPPLVFPADRLNAKSDLGVNKPLLTMQANKLECLYLARLYSLVYCLRVRPFWYSFLGQAPYLAHKYYTKLYSGSIQNISSSSQLINGHNKVVLQYTELEVLPLQLIGPIFKL